MSEDRPQKARYGHLEWEYSEPFATALVVNPAFRAWVLRQTKFEAFADESRVLDSEMKAARTKTATTWWRSHWHGKCSCKGCVGGQETDILAVFEAISGYRFALHMEVKQPKDGFRKGKDQAANCAQRAICWARTAPSTVVQHADAATVLLCSSRQSTDSRHAQKFGTVITFEEIVAAFPDLGMPST